MRPKLSVEQLRRCLDVVDLQKHPISSKARFLIPSPEDPDFSIWQNIQKAKNGELVSLYYRCPDWYSCPQGVIIENEGRLLRNGLKLLYDGDFYQWRSGPNGFIIRNYVDEFLLNGAELIVKDDGEISSWRAHNRGLVMRKNETIFLNGEKICNVRVLEKEDWRCGLDGIIVRKGKKFYLNNDQLLLDTSQMFGKLWANDWRAWGNNLVFRWGQEFYLNGDQILMGKIPSIPKDHDRWGTCMGLSGIVIEALVPPSQNKEIVLLKYSLP